LAFLRIEEVVQSGISDHALEVDVICIHYMQNKINVTMNSSKTDEYGKKETLQISKNIEKKICPFQNIELFLKMRPKIKGPLFIHLNYRVVTRFHICSIIKSTLRIARYNPGQYNIHSFRIGTATTAIMLGKTDDQIKQMSRWKSNTFQTYIRLGFLI
jgi:hypothetical protein